MMNENYIPLYRKYRPQKLEEVVGQEHIKKTLKSAIELGKISHAYLFTGPRGTGKTSTARILAKSLNCVNGPTISPCNECASCKDVTNTVPIDVIEIDAASNRKVEDTQSILEKIQYTPVHGHYKIYIIDEVHMLTNHAFNALLKTLEEPPENVIFILATTEVHKVLDTIKSRCQRFDFRRITTEDIVKHLRSISDKENININDDALFAIAKNSAGGMRDSIALLDQLSLLGAQKEVTLDDVNNMLGRLSFDLLKQISDCIINSDTQGALELLEKVYNSGNEPTLILSNLCEYFKNLLITKNARQELLEELTGLNDAQTKELIEQVKKLETHQIVFLLEKIANYIRELKQTNNQYLWLEVAIIDLANLANNTSLLALQNRIQALESGVVSAPRQVMTSVSRPQVQEARPQPAISAPKSQEQEVKPQVTLASQAQPMQESKNIEPAPVVAPTDTSDLAGMWQALVRQISSPSTQALLRLANPVKVAPDEIIITFKQEIFVKQANDDSKKQVIAAAANKLFNQSNTLVTIRLPQSGDAQLPKSQAAPSVATAPVKQSAPSPVSNPAPQVASNVVSEKLSVTPVVVDVDEPENGVVNVAPKQNIEKSAKDYANADQTKMITDLFDGKFI